MSQERLAEMELASEGVDLSILPRRGKGIGHTARRFREDKAMDVWSKYHDGEPWGSEEPDEFGRFWPWNRDMPVTRAVTWWLIQHLFLPIAQRETHLREWWRFGKSPLRWWKHILRLWARRKKVQ